MSLLNPETGVPEKTQAVWTGAVGLDTYLVDPVTGRCARMIVVGTVGLGPLNVVEAGAVARSYTAVEINAANRILRGNFEQVVAAGSGSFDLTVGI